MSEDYVPTTEQVRAHYTGTDAYQGERGAEFDTWFSGALQEAFEVGMRVGLAECGKVLDEPDQEPDPLGVTQPGAVQRSGE